MQLISVGRRKPSRASFDNPLVAMALAASSPHQRSQRSATMGAFELLGDYELLGAGMVPQNLQMRPQNWAPPQYQPRGAPQGYAPPQGAPHIIQTQPTRQRVTPLGFDSVSTVAAGVAASISQQPQVVFRPERLVIPAAVADFFQVNDLKVGKNSQFASSGNVPASAFVAGGFDVRLKMDTANIGQLITIAVSNIDSAAHRFTAALLGPSAE